MNRRYLTVREVLTASPEFFLSVVSECRRDGNFRYRSVGTVYNLVYDTKKRVLNWSDSEGDPTVTDIDLDDKIEFHGGGKWTYGLYIDENQN